MGITHIWDNLILKELDKKKTRISKNPTYWLETSSGVERGYTCHVQFATSASFSKDVGGKTRRSRSKAGNGESLR